ncbi:hypothetical protein CLF_108784 [Clonorchis sinensis]|uniref:Uncharacterized protein n=1 Tax=Clonorchis sinensis TaxID=79923 RepID=G7YII9_CLOSI|nr:hypothetical protein CLF_108784 [Clonorchis sinensis]
MVPQTLCNDIAPYLGVHSNTQTLLHSPSERRSLMDKTACVNRTIIEAPLRHVLTNTFYWVEDSADCVNKTKYDHDINDCALVEAAPNIEARMTRVWSWLRNPLSEELSPCDLYLLESYNSTPSPHPFPSTCHEAVCSYPQVDNSPGSRASPTGRPDGSSSIDETGDAVTTTDQPESAVDETLTLLKLEELRQYVKHLETSIRSNESARKEKNRNTLSAPNCHATRGKHEGWDTAKLPKRRQGKSRCRGRIRTTDLWDPKQQILTVSQPWHNDCYGSKEPTAVYFCLKRSLQNKRDKQLALKQAAVYEAEVATGSKYVPLTHPLGPTSDRGMFCLWNSGRLDMNSKRLELYETKVMKTQFRTTSCHHIVDCTTPAAELNDWLFEQMTGITISPGDSSTSEGEIKRVFEDRSKILKQHAKTLSDQLQATQFVVQTLEAHGIPRDVSPKSYVRELLKRRGKGATPGFPPSPRSPPARESNEPTESQNPPSRERPSHTLPALPTTSSRTPDLNEARRHAQTLPSERTYSQELSSTRRISDPDPLAPLFRPSPLLSAAARLKPTGSLASLSHYGKPSLDPQTNPDKPHFVPASNVCLPAPRPLPFSSHPTSPELFSISYADDSVEAGSKPLRVSLPLSEHKPETSGAGGGVFHTVRHGLEMFGRQFRRPRSASEENVIAATKAAVMSNWQVTTLSVLSSQRPGTRFATCFTGFVGIIVKPLQRFHQRFPLRSTYLYDLPIRPRNLARINTNHQLAEFSIIVLVWYATMRFTSGAVSVSYALEDWMQEDAEACHSPAQRSFQVRTQHNAERDVGSVRWVGIFSSEASLLSLIGVAITRKSEQAQRTGHEHERLSRPLTHTYQCTCVPASNEAAFTGRCDRGAKQAEITKYIIIVSWYSRLAKQSNRPRSRTAWMGPKLCKVGENCALSVFAWLHQNSCLQSNGIWFSAGSGGSENTSRDSSVVKTRKYGPKVCRLFLVFINSNNIFGDRYCDPVRGAFVGVSDTSRFALI